MKYYIIASLLVVNAALIIPEENRSSLTVGHVVAASVFAPVLAPAFLLSRFIELLDVRIFK